MNDTYTNIGDLLLNGRYQLLQQVFGSIGGVPVYLGNKGVCRYCDERDPKMFRTVAHTFPEALGNKWVFSRDECDRCNKKVFSLYDEELTKAVSPFLTLGGVKGKGNKVRATGRTGGASHIEQRRDAEGKRSIVAAATGFDLDTIVSADPTGRRIQLKTPIAPVPFKPRFAYKALAKMGVALLPPEELVNYRKLIAWLLDPADSENFPVLEVGMSFASVGNAPAHAVGQLLRRTNPRDVIPHIIFIFCAGSICLQIDLLSDRMEEHIPFTTRGSINISCNIVVGDDAGNTLRFAYGAPKHLNWASSHTAPQPVESMVLDFDMQTTGGRWTPVFREQG
jgi:hypothetical protein